LPQQEFLKKLDIWARQQGSYIKDQWAKLGFAVSYKSECFTLDQNVANLVNQLFVDLYQKGLVYQDYKLVN